MLNMMIVGNTKTRIQRSEAPTAASISIVATETPANRLSTTEKKQISAITAMLMISQLSRVVHPTFE
ncbi:hypothetical protein JCM19046_4341 [Bacillus sp. JCM 19046]|nr:hypothetical protein JCM19045_4913 [Bacillus sp. JCM 19045]GAF19673.1 hypothetical protein JCM19046_4341 [Bacillus sp. JCM 19046]